MIVSHWNGYILRVGVIHLICIYQVHLCGISSDDSTNIALLQADRRRMRERKIKNGNKNLCIEWRRRQKRYKTQNCSAPFPRLAHVLQVNDTKLNKIITITINTTTNHLNCKTNEKKINKNIEKSQTQVFKLRSLLLVPTFAWGGRHCAFISVQHTILFQRFSELLSGAYGRQQVLIHSLTHSHSPIVALTRLYTRD